MTTENTSFLPEGFRTRMREFLGGEVDAFENSFHREPRRALRVNTRRVSAREFYEQNRQCFGLSPVPWAGAGFYYRTEGECRPGKHPYHEAGLYYIQEPSAMAAAALSGAEPGERILDLCAAPGGKTTQLADRMEGRGLLVANEIHPQRARILSQNVERMGVANAVVTNESPERLEQRFPAFFDRIVVDAPCSGEGMFLREEQARSGWTTDNIRLCARRQDAVLDSAAAMLCDGGVLVYSTCTFAPEENEGTVARFLLRHPDFHTARIPEALRFAGFDSGRPEFLKASVYDRELAPEGMTPAIEEELCRAIRLWPHRLEGEGHFVCLLQREGSGRPGFAQTGCRRRTRRRLSCGAPLRMPRSGAGGRCFPERG